MRIASALTDLSMSQNSFYMIKEFNKLIANPDISAGAFYQRSSIPATQPLFGVKMCAHLSSYNGVIIPTTLELAEMCLKTSSNAQIYFYVWDLDWTDSPVYFDNAVRIMRNDRVQILARSQSHAECIENFCNKKPCGIVDNWNVDDLLRIIGETK
jgi:hypothetical protein